MFSTLVTVSLRQAAIGHETYSGTTSGGSDLRMNSF
jgi:hypothetical protein